MLTAQFVIRRFDAESVMVHTTGAAQTMMSAESTALWGWVQTHSSEVSAFVFASSTPLTLLCEFTHLALDALSAVRQPAAGCKRYRQGLSRPEHATKLLAPTKVYTKTPTHSLHPIPYILQVHNNR